MIRYSALILLAVLMVGCQGSAPTTDPFFGRTIIPPPGTGSATGQYSDPCYQTPPGVTMPPGVTAPPNVTMPTTPMAPAAAGTAQPGSSPDRSYLFQGPVQPKSVPRPTSTGTPNNIGPPSSTIPPPGTSGSTYTNPPPSTNAPGRMATPPPASTSPPPGINSPYSPPSGNPTAPAPKGWTPSGSSSSNTEAYTPGKTVSLPASSSVVGDPTPRPIDSGGDVGTPPPRTPIIRTLQPREKSENIKKKRVIDIMDLPPAS